MIAAAPYDPHWLLWPTEQVWPWGQGWRPATPERKGHNGVDLRCPYGTPLRTVGPCRVTAIGQGGPSGIFAIVRLAGGVSAGYAHMSERDVQVDQILPAGFVCGLSGNTGHVLPEPTPAHPRAGAHLHFTLRVLYEGALRVVDPAARFNPADVAAAKRLAA